MLSPLYAHTEHELFAQGRICNMVNCSDGIGLSFLRGDLCHKSARSLNMQDCRREVSVL